MRFASDSLRFESTAKNAYHLIEIADVTIRDYICFAYLDYMWTPDLV